MFFGYNAHLLPFMCVSYQLLAILDWYLPIHIIWRAFPKMFSELIVFY
jgi:hypothetical protein